MPYSIADLKRKHAEKKAGETTRQNIERANKLHEKAEHWEWCRQMALGRLCEPRWENGERVDGFLYRSEIEPALDVTPTANVPRPGAKHFWVGLWFPGHLTVSAEMVVYRGSNHAEFLDERSPDQRNRQRRWKVSTGTYDSYVFPSLAEALAYAEKHHEPEEEEVEDAIPF